MPFDSLPTEHPHASELAVLDRMAEILATPSPGGEADAPAPGTIGQRTPPCAVRR